MCGENDVYYTLKIDTYAMHTYIERKSTTTMMIMYDEEMKMKGKEKEREGKERKKVVAFNFGLISNMNEAKRIR